MNAIRDGKPGISLTELQQQLAPWVQHNFGEREPWQPLLGLQEELGELSHAFLKRHQGIRVNEDHNAAIKDAVADLVIFLCDFCNGQGIDLEHEVATTWQRVRLRDWKANPATATTDAPTPAGT